VISRAGRSAVGSLLVAVALTGAGTTAHANGRFPASNGVIFSPADDGVVLVRVTFGLLVTHDRGKSWGWICERAIGFSGPEDPSYVITKSGAIVAGLFDGLRVSRDGGCSWEAVKTDATVFVDLTSRSDGAVVALASSYDRHGDAGSLYKTQLWISTDDARSFVPMAPRFDPTLLGESVEVAPGDPSRVYVSAVRGDDVGRQGVLLVSSDGGKHWTERATKLEGKELAPFIAAVDPKRADRIYLRTSASPENPTRLLVTDDAGKTYRKLLGAKGPLLGFALAPDGTSLHAGGPDDGLFAGSAGADAGELTQQSKLKVQCLARNGDALWACSSEAGGFVAGVAEGGGAKFDARLHLRDVAGPLACAEGTAVAKECGIDWGKLKGELGLGQKERANADAGAKADANADAKAEGGTREAALQRSRGAWIGAIVAVLGGAIVLMRARRRRR
jgi:photosystem II stability/assembly factor-like uncharacterized protein